MSIGRHYLSMEELAELLGVSRKLIRNLCDDGTIPFIRVGKHIRIHIDVIKLLAANPAGRTTGQRQYDRHRIAKMRAGWLRWKEEQARGEANGGDQTVAAPDKSSETGDPE